MGNGFWSISLGNVLTLGGLLFSFWLAHRANVQRLEDQATRIAKMETKLDLIFGWFEHNVIGRGEKPRTSGEGGD